MKNHIPYTISPVQLRFRRQCHSDRCYKCSIPIEVRDTVVTFGSRNYIAHYPICYNKVYISVSDEGLEEIEALFNNNNNENSLSPLIEEEVY